MNLSFTAEQKIQFLTLQGFEVRELVVEMNYPIYHNDMEYGEALVVGVFKDANEYNKPTSYNFGKYEWLDGVFEKEFQTKVFQLICGDQVSVDDYQLPKFTGKDWARIFLDTEDRQYSEAWKESRIDYNKDLISKERYTRIKNVGLVKVFK